MENKVLMPRVGVNDDYARIAQWLIKNGEKVGVGQKIAIIETTKETTELEADYEGYIVLKVAEGNDAEVGKIIALICDNPVLEEKEEKASLDNYKITTWAKELVRKYNIDISKLPSDILIKEKDIMRMISQPYQIAEIKSNKVLIYGGGRMSKVIIDILKHMPGYSIKGIIDTNYPDKKEVMGVPVIGNDDLLETVYAEGYHKIFNSIGFNGNKHWRKPPYEMLKAKGFEFINVIHPTAIVDISVEMGEGNYVGAGASISADTKIGSNCFINAASVIAHDCIISDHCHIASGSVLAGGVIVGENSLIGQNCSVYMNVKIGKNVVIQNGCHIFKDISDNEVVLLG